MRKIATLLVLILFAVSAFAQEAGNGQTSQGSLSPSGANGIDPIQSVIQDTLKANQRLIAKHKDVADYFNKFLPLWTDLFKKLQDAQQNAGGLEDQFQKYYDVLQKETPRFDDLRVPSDFKDFNKAVSKGLNDLSDWVLDMRDRIHYATTDYQRDAYMSRLEDFQKNWYDKFFGPSLEALNGNWAVYTTYFWKDNLPPDQLAAIQKNPSLSAYLSRYHRIMYDHMKNALSLAQKARKARDDDDDSAGFLANVKKEAADLGNTRKNLSRLTPPSQFEDFQTMELNLLQVMQKGTILFSQIETDAENNVPDEKLSPLIDQKNQLDEQTKTLQDSVEDAYQQALQAAVSQTATKP